ncbi:MAG: transporter substrate-binding domain-containing protein, partial [Lachnospiraceae bacterium]|nr:transporter substrate-binding domain-containing protein [Lachnospiraceae bacterium]
MKKLVWRRKLFTIFATAALGAALTGCGSQPSNAASAINTENIDNADSETTVSDTNAEKQTQVRIIKGVTGGSLAPYMYIDENNELTGVDIEIAKEVFSRIPEYDLEIEVADALQGVLSGQYDIAINNYGYTDARAESYYFSYPYKTTYNVYIQRPDDTPLASLQDIADRGYKIELDAGGLTANALEQWNADNPEHQIDIIYTETNFQVKFEHLIDKTADVAIDDGPILDTLLEKFGLEGQL